LKKEIRNFIIENEEKASVNEIYQIFFSEDKRPARQTIKNLINETKRHK
jgi:hypothetical protein